MLNITGFSCFGGISSYSVYVFLLTQVLDVMLLKLFYVQERGADNYKVFKIAISAEKELPKYCLFASSKPLWKANLV